VILLLLNLSSKEKGSKGERRKGKKLSAIPLQNNHASYNLGSNPFCTLSKTTNRKPNIFKKARRFDMPTRYIASQQLKKLNL
jgi:hypothetical protein